MQENEPQSDSDPSRRKAERKKKIEDKSRAEEHESGERGNQRKMHEKEERKAVRDYDKD